MSRRAVLRTCRSPAHSARARAVITCGGTSSPCGKIQLHEYIHTHCNADVLKYQEVHSKVAWIYNAYRSLVKINIEKEKQGSAGDGTSGGSDVLGGVSASLTPTIWDKTIPYDGETFHLEYMDLDEFLLENGIPVTLEEELNRSLEAERHASGDTQESPNTQTPEAERDGEPEEEEEEEPSVSDVEEQDVSDDEATTDSRAEPERATPSPMDPEEIEVNISFQPDPTDLVLSSVPGGELFNPRKHRFSEDELKPQPMIKKAKKVFVAEDAKDDKYWCRRKKNNVAAKRSRDARRLKENQIAVRASFLERENAAMRREVAELRKDCGRCQKIMSLYEDKYGAL